MSRHMTSRVLLALFAVTPACGKKSQASAQTRLSPSALCAELAGKQLVSDCKPYVGAPMPTPTKEHVLAEIKFGDRIAYSFEFIEYESQEAAENGVLKYKELYKEGTGKDNLEAVVSPKQPLVTFYAPINEEGANEAANKLARVLTIVRAQ
jgi:hypothetical protein